MQVHLRKEAKRTNSSTLDHVADCESFYRLILWRTPRAIGAADRLDMTPSLLVATAVADISCRLEISGFRHGKSYLDARFLTMIAVSGGRSARG